MTSKGSDSLRLAAHQLVGNGVGAPLVHRGARPVGVFREQELARAVVDRRDLDCTTAEGHMALAAARIDDEASLEEAIGEMRRRETHHLLTDAAGEIVGIESACDLPAALPEPARRAIQASMASGDPQPAGREPANHMFCVDWALPGVPALAAAGGTKGARDESAPHGPRDDPGWRPVCEDRGSPHPRPIGERPN